MPAQPSESHMCSQQPSESHMRGNEEMRQREKHWIPESHAEHWCGDGSGMWHVIGEVSTPVVGPF